MNNLISEKKISIILMVTMIITMLGQIPQQNINAQAKAGITNVDMSPEIIYVREGQSKNLFSCISSLSYVDSSGKTKSYTDSGSAENALKSLTQNVKLTNTGGTSSLTVDQNGNIKATKNGENDPVVILSFSSGSASIKVIIQDVKPNIENERFVIYDDGESGGKMQIFLEYPDNTTNHQYRVGNGFWQNVDAGFTASVDGVNYYKGMVLLDSVENVSIRCQGVVGGKWSDMFTYAMAEENSGVDIENDNSSVIAEDVQAIKTKDTKSSISLAYGTSAKLSGSLYSDELITKVSIAIDGWNNGKDGVLVSEEPKTKSFDLSNFLIDAGSVPFNKAGEYTVDVWAKTTTYTNPKEPVFTFKVTVGAARKITLVVKNGSEYVSKALVKINDVSYYTDANGKFVLDKAMASTHTLYIANQYYVFNGKIDTNRSDFNETIGCYTLPVIVKDESGNVVQGANVKLGNIIASYSNGKYLFRNVAPGKHTLIVNIANYINYSSSIKVNPQYKIENDQVNVIMKKQSIPSTNNNTSGGKTNTNNSSKDSDGDGILDSEDLEPQIKYQVPIVLIHGRTDNSYSLYGVPNEVANGKNIKNNGYVGDKNYKFAKTEFSSYNNQAIVGKMVNRKLGASLTSKQFGGYIPNQNLFVFNYPNVDMVNLNATILKSYLSNLAKEMVITDDYVAQNKFFGSKTNLNKSKKGIYTFQVNIIAHSMGGLISRYYIEKLNGSSFVKKLITVDTPHFGSVLGEVSQNSPGINKLGGGYYPCDADLIIGQKIYSGVQKGNTGTLADKWWRGDKVYAYEHLTNQLTGEHGKTQYYFIVGYDCDSLTLPIDTVYPIVFKLTNKGFWNDAKAEFDKMYLQESENSIKHLGIDPGDGVVGTLSQAGISEDIKNVPNVISAKKIGVIIEMYLGDSTVANQLHSGILTKSEINVHTFDMIGKFIDEK